MITTNTSVGHRSSKPKRDDDLNAVGMHVFYFRQVTEYLNIWSSVIDLQLGLGFRYTLFFFSLNSDFYNSPAGGRQGSGDHIRNISNDVNAVSVHVFVFSSTDRVNI